MKRFSLLSETAGYHLLVERAAQKTSQFFSIISTFALISMVPSVASAAVVISEFMAANDTVLFDEDGDAEDWIELHNDGSTAVNISNWHLTDDDGDLSAWSFPNTILQADEYLVVFASGKDRAISSSELHTNFKLKASGEYLALVLPDGVNVVSEYAPEYPQQFDTVYLRWKYSI